MRFFALCFLLGLTPQTIPTPPAPEPKMVAVTKRLSVQADVDVDHNALRITDAIIIQVLRTCTLSAQRRHEPVIDHFWESVQIGADGKEALVHVDERGHEPKDPSYHTSDCMFYGFADVQFPVAEGGKPYKLTYNWLRSL